MFFRVCALLALSFSLASWGKVSSFTELKSITKNTAGDFQLTFDRSGGDGPETITLLDTDGLPTLAATQQIIVRDIYNAKQSRDLKMNDYYIHSLVGIQLDALEKVIAECQKYIADGNGEGVIPNTGMTVNEVVKKAKELRQRKFVKMPWGVEDIEKMGAFVKSLAPGGTDYTASFVRKGNLEIKKVNLYDSNNRTASFLNGQLSDGYFLPSYFLKDGNPPQIGKTFLGGESDRIIRDYRKNYDAHNSSKGISVESAEERMVHE